MQESVLRNYINIFHLTWIMSLHYLVKLEMLTGHALPLTCQRKNSRNYPTWTVACKFARFECSWLQSVGTIAREGVQNTHHWSGRTETATENGVGQARSRRYCGSHSSVESSIGSRSVMRVLYTFSCNISHMLLSTEFKSEQFGGHSWGGMNSGVSFCNNTMVAHVQWAFQVLQGSVDYSGEVEKIYIILQQSYSGDSVPNFVIIAQVLLDITKKHFDLFFSGHSVYSPQSA